MWWAERCERAGVDTEDGVYALERIGINSIETGVYALFLAIGVTLVFVWLTGVVRALQSIPGVGDLEDAGWRACSERFLREVRKSLAGEMDVGKCVTTGSPFRRHRIASRDAAHAYTLRLACCLKRDALLIMPKIGTKTKANKRSVSVRPTENVIVPDLMGLMLISQT